MVLTLKVISCSINYNDGMLKEEGLREAQKKNRLIRMPSLIEYFGYCLCCGSHFAGPVFEMKDYLEWTEEKGVSVFLSHSSIFVLIGKKASLDLSSLIVLWISDLGCLWKRKATIALWSNYSSCISSCDLYGFISLFSTSVSVNPVH